MSGYCLKHTRCRAYTIGLPINRDDDLWLLSVCVFIYRACASGVSFTLKVDEATLERVQTKPRILSRGNHPSRYRSWQ